MNNQISLTQWNELLETVMNSTDTQAALSHVAQLLDYFPRDRIEKKC